MRHVPALMFAGLLPCLFAVPGPAQPPQPAAPPPVALTPEQSDFFEKRIRPVLTEHCYSCHSADAAAKKKLKGGLLLDTRDGLLAGGDSGKAFVPGKPAESLLIECMKYGGDVKMPPKGKLPDAVIADFERWVAMGAPDPRTGGSSARKTGMDVETGRSFWSYKPVVLPAVPAVKDAAWCANDIDRFVLAKLEAAALPPAAPAERAVLVRRLYFDLIGVPPTPEEVDAFLADGDPAAYEKLVDRLLADPRFGERWGRHWLDVARYADSVTLRGFIFKEAWRYRDYVIGSFNADLPFDRFLREQLAGDLLPAADKESRTRQVVATTYLQLGNTNLEEQDKKQLRMDVIDEQLDVIGKGLLGQTITCARCHDHKFDPIPTKDYYALAGILRNVRALEDANVSKWVEVPLPMEPDAEAEVKKYDAAVAALQARIKAAKSVVPKDATQIAAKGVLAVKDVPGIVIDDAKATKIGDWMDSKFNNSYIGEGYCHDKDAGKGEKSITFDPDLPATGKYEVWLAYSPGANRAANVPVKVFSADGEKDFTIDMRFPPPLQGRYMSLGQYRFEKDGQSFVIISNEGTKGHVTPDAVTFIPVEKLPPMKPATAEPAPKAKAAPAEDPVALEAELKKLQANPPKRPMAMSVVEEKKIEELKVHVRGSVHNLGEPAPRGVLQVATVGAPPKMPADQSGRVQLAEWIASPQNPLTARVFANRAWHWLFGSGIVRTVDNFGTTGELPSHPELLDYLAATFVQDGWSVKKLVRRIVLSRTYRQSSTIGPQAMSLDVENKLFGRANRRRLDAECIRDTILTVSGKLSPERGGPMFAANIGADYAYKHTATCRSVYMPVFRNSLPELFEAFDFADPSMVTGRRNVSTVAPQALFMMNNPFVIDQARHAAARLLAEKHADDAAAVVRAYRLALGRPPTAGEKAVALKYLAGQPRLANATWAALFHALFASADFRNVE